MIVPASACLPLFFSLHTSEKRLCASLQHAPVVGSSNKLYPDALQGEKIKFSAFLCTS